jgi:hypothetical protein
VWPDLLCIAGPEGEKGGPGVAMAFFLPAVFGFSAAFAEPLEDLARGLALQNSALGAVSGFARAISKSGFKSKFGHHRRWATAL